MVMNTSRRIKSLEYHVEHLKLEIEEITEEMRSYSSSFFNDLVKDLAEQSQNDIFLQNSAPCSNLPEEFDNIVKKDDESEDVKKLWKKIMLLTHPDKTGNNPRLTRIYKRAVEARQKSYVQDLIVIAVELGISSNFSHELTIKCLEQLEENLQQKLNEIENSVLIQWGRSKDVEEKKRLIEFYIEAKRKTSV